ncbi:MAG: hypothetical protein V7642_3777 [Burkholderiales bacterium]
METTIISFLPMLIMQAIYAIFVAQIAKRTNKNVPVYVIVSLIPFVGAFFFIYVMWSTVLSVLDSINELKAQKGVSI